ncbi:SAP domain-containing protein [Mammaliicoccus sciuri]|uniref:SAP domain-containing protein n=1 Tax=Mammaliicoccus sciuri TaxID=1296 RepID=UPI002DBD1A61|nr:SAP domain-containing protein [Mammaliicoccus sciuri]MEB6232536.1 SAP domain-containing protein [Mammaliicoccus sciuri]
MKIEPIDISVLHTNANRLQGNEDIYAHFKLNNRKRILKSIDKLVLANLLKLENSLEVSLPRLTKPDLISILKKAKIKSSGNKPALIERIIENIDYINGQNIEIDLPTVYMPTAEGLELIEETKYIVHFSRGTSGLSIERAYNIIKECEEENIKDKIEYIYLCEIARLHKSKPIPKVYHDTSNNIYFYFSDLADYYKQIEEYDKSIKYYHLAQYLNIYDTIETLENNPNSFYNYEGELDLHFLNAMPYGMDEVYEKLLYIDELSNDELFHLYIEDVSEYYTPKEDFSRVFINHNIAKAKKNDIEIDKIVSDFKKWFVTNYPYNELKVQNSYEHKETDTVLTTNLKTLLENDVDIKLEIVKESGEVYIYIDQDERERIFESELVDKLNTFNS